MTGDKDLLRRGRVRGTNIVQVDEFLAQSRGRDSPRHNRAMHVFISWSMDRSRIIAEAFRDWLPMVLQFVDAWMSAADIKKGARSEGEIADRLEAADVRIVCLTPENLSRPWILMEAGALSKRVGKDRVCTLRAELRSQDVEPLLSVFQDTDLRKDDTRNLVLSINKFGGEARRHG